MTEVLFGEGEAESMRYAKQNGTMPDEADNEVICLGFMLDIGNISKGIKTSSRKRLPVEMLAGTEYEKNNTGFLTSMSAKDKENLYISQWDKLMSILKSGKSIRIWYSNLPYSLCGLYQLCTALVYYPTQVTVIKIPEYNIVGNSMTIANGWDVIQPENFCNYLSYERKLTKMEITYFSSEWKRLEVENKKLRAVVSGKLMSVREDFYDFLILDAISDEAENEIRFIGRILAKNQIGVGEWWLKKRIEVLISEGVIEVIYNSQTPSVYDRMIRKYKRKHYHGVHPLKLYK